MFPAPAKKPAPPSPGMGGQGNPGDLLSMLGGGGLGGMPMPGMGGPMGGGLPPMGMPGPGMPKPGRGMDAMSAMMGGLGLQQPPSPGGMDTTSGPEGFPIGATIPDLSSPDQMGGSDLLSMLSGGGAGGAGKYSNPPDMTSGPPVGTPAEDPGMQQLMQLLALGQLGVNPVDAGMNPAGGNTGGY